MTFLTHEFYFDPIFLVLVYAEVPLLDRSGSSTVKELQMTVQLQSKHEGAAPDELCPCKVFCKFLTANINSNM